MGRGSDPVRLVAQRTGESAREGRHDTLPRDIRTAGRPGRPPTVGRCSSLALALASASTGPAVFLSVGLCGSPAGTASVSSCRADWRGGMRRIRRGFAASGSGRRPGSDGARAAPGARGSCPVDRLGSPGVSYSQGPAAEYLYSIIDSGKSQGMYREGIRTSCLWTPVLGFYLHAAKETQTGESELANRRGWGDAFGCDTAEDSPSLDIYIPVLRD